MSGAHRIPASRMPRPDGLPMAGALPSQIREDSGLVTFPELESRARCSLVRWDGKSPSDGHYELTCKEPGNGWTLHFTDGLGEAGFTGPHVSAAHALWAMVELAEPHRKPARGRAEKTEVEAP